METLNPTEARVLGVLIEKGYTTPEQYPLTLNSLVSGANQKNNRYPLLALGEDEVHDAVQALRDKGLAIHVDQAGARTRKFKHAADEKLTRDRYELAIVAELLLRGAQTAGELRSRAGRMAEYRSLEHVQEVLERLMSREEPLVKRLPPMPGSRAERYRQLLAEEPEVESHQANAEGFSVSDTALIARIERLESAVRRLAQSLGEPDPLADEGARPSES